MDIILTEYINKQERGQKRIEAGQELGVRNSRNLVSQMENIAVDSEDSNVDTRLDCRSVVRSLA